MEEDPPDSQRLRTVRRVGYRFFSSPSHSYCSYRSRGLLLRTPNMIWSATQSRRMWKTPICFHLLALCVCPALPYSVLDGKRLITPLPPPFSPRKASSVVHNLARDSGRAVGSAFPVLSAEDEAFALPAGWFRPLRPSDWARPRLRTARRSCLLPVDSFGRYTQRRSSGW